jgi:hypothetical protein
MAAFESVFRSSKFASLAKNQVIARPRGQSKGEWGLKHVLRYSKLT